MISMIVLISAVLLVILRPFTRKAQIMRFYNKEKNVIEMPSDEFYNLRHCDGYLQNNGLWFPRGYMDDPEYNNGDKRIRVILKEF